MAKPNFYFVYIERKEDISYTQVEEKMDLSIDWYRLNEQVWILYTTSDEERWYKRLSKFVKPGGILFIVKLEIENRQGWMDNSFWKWIRREVEDDD